MPRNDFPGMPAWGTSSLICGYTGCTLGPSDLCKIHKSAILFHMLNVLWESNNMNVRHYLVRSNSLVIYIVESLS